MQQTSSIFSASMLSANWTRFGEEAHAMLAAGVDWLHIDVMDNHYVPNLSFGAALCQALRKEGIKVPLDVHLMANPVDRLIFDFAKAGASLITVHPEACLHVHRTMTQIKELGCQVGIALNPGTPIDCLDHLMEMVDLILVMTVNPGFSGQQFISSLLPKIESVRQRIIASKRDIYLQVDGGLDLNNIKRVQTAGANTFVMGSTLFKSPDYAKMVAMLRTVVG
ncbi:MAG: hypothetical protein RLZ35_37 [Pseudomonadota bacterium]|jgi:ribulose-phosphate 3-epimerase